MTGDTLGSLYLRRFVQGAMTGHFGGDGYAVLNAEDGSVEVEDRYMKRRFVVEVRVFEVEGESK
jgi:hypothetical protein